MFIDKENYVIPEQLDFEVGDMDFAVPQKPLPYAPAEMLALLMSEGYGQQEAAELALGRAELIRPLIMAYPIINERISHLSYVISQFLDEEFDMSRKQVLRELSNIARDKKCSYRERNTALNSIARMQGFDKPIQVEISVDPVKELMDAVTQ